MGKSIFNFVCVIVAILLFAGIALFGINLGFTQILPVSEGVKLGLDLVGGSEITYNAVVPEGMSGAEVSEGLEIAKTMLRQRLESLGYTEASIYNYGSQGIVVEIPNVGDPEEAVQLLGTTAVVEFRDHEGNVVLEGKDIESALASYGAVDSTGVNQYHVSLKLSGEGREKFREATKIAAGLAGAGTNYVTITMDGEIISQPYVDSSYASTGIDTDSPIITLGSNATLEYSKYLAEIISAGSLPFELKNVKLQAIGATLGERSLETSLIAGAIGVALVMLFMLIFYRLPGLVACIALALYVAVFAVVLSATGVNLTLPGIAGIILTIGMAVDANVIIYERIKEELRVGKTIKASIDSGYKRAFTAILDSNITTAIAAVALWWQGTGTIVGFAKTLLIGVILSMFCMIFVTRIIINCFVGFKIRNPRAYGM